MPKNYKKVKVSTIMFSELFKTSQKLIEITDGLPEDAKLVRITPGHKEDHYWFVFESEEFEDVEEGEKIPETDVEFTSHEKPVTEIDIEVNLEEVKELRKELEKIKELKEEINRLDKKEEDESDIDFPDIGDPTPRPKFPRDPAFPKYFCDDGEGHSFEADENILADTNIEI